MQKSIENYLEAADGAGSVLAHAKLLIKLGHQYQLLVPAHLGKVSRLVNYTSGTVVIYADNNAVATKLRQLSNTLAEGFSRKGWQCNDVQVKVQVHEKHEQLREVMPRIIDRESVSELEKLRESLPNSPLRDAVAKLLDRSLKEQ